MDRSQAYNPTAHAAFKALEPPIPVLGDADEWRAWNAVGDPVLHIQVRAEGFLPDGEMSGSPYSVSKSY